MLSIRLFRVGRKHQPAFKIVVTDKRRSSTRGRFVEEVGIYNPLTKQRNLKGDRVKYWMSVGAKPSDTVHNMLVAENIIEGEKIAKHNPPKKKEGGEEAPKAEATPEESTEATKEQAKEPTDETSDNSASEETKETPVKEEQKEEPKAEDKEEQSTETPKEEAAKTEEKPAA